MLVQHLHKRIRVELFHIPNTWFHPLLGQHQSGAQEDGGSATEEDAAAETLQRQRRRRRRAPCALKQLKDLEKILGPITASLAVPQ